MRISILLSRFPFPLEKGDKLRIYHQIRVLSAHHSIQLIALHEGKLPPEHLNELEPFCEDIQVFTLKKPRQFLQIIKALFNGSPLQTGYFFHSDLHRNLSSILSIFRTDVAYFQLPRTGPYANQVKCKKVLDYQDVFSQGMFRQYKKAAWFLKPIIWMEFKRMRAYEAQLLEVFDASTIISEQDRDWIHHPKKTEIEIVRNGVDFDFFKPNDSIKPTYDLVFVGNMSYPPNVVAAEFLVNEILPQMKTKAKVLIAGANPHRKVQKLASDQVVISGWLDDIREAYWKSKVFIAPMNIGTGLQNKLLEAMSMGMPAITTPLANNALKANSNQIHIGKTGEELAKLADALLQDKAEAEKLGQAGKAYVHAHFSWEAATEPLDAILRS